SLAIPGVAAAKRFGAPFTWSVTFVAILAAAGAFGVALAFMHPPGALAGVPVFLERLHLGAIVSGMLTGASAPLLGLFLATVALIVGAYYCALDLYPELYEASLSSFEHASRLRAFGRGRSTEKYQLRSTGASHTALSGGWTIVWKEWLGFRRSPSSRFTVVVSVLFIVAAGVAGRMLGAMKEPEALFIGVALPAFTMSILVMMMTTVSLASDLRKPIWWLGPDTLRMRLYAWIVSITWRMSAILFFALAAYAVISASVLRVPWFLALAVLMPLTLRAVSLATYAILPAPADQRGPLAILRVFIMLAMFLPPAIAYFAAAFLLRNLGAEIAALLLVSVLQIAGLVEFASWRMNGAGSSFALAEQSA
ncbi:MAG: hypothetical protein GIW97_07005, partial [Candidatus Eremiobacteraeota bacterium]|nr:hypothetical protein [Candidatus Eremiobacteraeota bacterium]